ncbi:aldehyde dehydrogenase family protein [Elusimicrobiota bacterium]
MPTTKVKKDSKQTKTVTLKQYINGKWIEGSDSREIRSINPANTKETLAIFKGASKDDALKALDAAQKAFPAWKATPAPARARYIDKVVRLARQKKEELAKIMTLEEGKILPEALGEMEKGINLLEWFVGEGTRFMGQTAPSELSRNLLYTIREPLGVVSIITPWNFPWAIPCWKIAPALVAGNTIVFKPASCTPWMGAEFVKLFDEAGIPPGVINLVLGSGSSMGDILVEDKRVQAVSFTGSNDIGTRVYQTAGKRGIKVTCEMGGKNPCVVMDDADMDLAMAGVMKGAFGSTGQRCTATSRLIVHERIADAFIKKMLDELKVLKVGDGMKPGIGMGPVVDKGQLDTVLGLIETAKKEGAKLIFGGGKPQGAEFENGYYVEPTVFDNCTDDMTIYQEEVFGPVLVIRRVKSFEEAVKSANCVRYGLTSAIYTQDISLAMRFVEETEVGMTHINSPTIGGEAQVPFGGTKESGVGEREMAKEGIFFFSKPKTVFLDYTGTKRKSSIY